MADASLCGSHPHKATGGTPRLSTVAGAGFMRGVGQGLVGAVAAPVSGGLDLFSSAIEGLDASKEVSAG